MRTIIFIIITLMFFLYSCATLSDKQGKPYAELKQYGLFSPSVKRRVPTETIFKDIDVVSATELKKQTTHIPCILGNRFGVLFEIHNLQENNDQEVLTINWSHPTIVSPSGREASSTSFQWPIGAREGDSKILYFDWGLEESFELVAGRWTISIYYQDIMILKQMFTVEGCNIA